jgi:hypothetical protein
MPAGGLLRGFSKHRALVLDSSYRPINTVNWFKAVCMDMAGKVDVIKYYDAYEPSAYRLHQLPAVVVVRHFVDIKEVRALLGSCCCAQVVCCSALRYGLHAACHSLLVGVGRVCHPHRSCCRSQHRAGSNLCPPRCWGVGRVSDALVMSTYVKPAEL